jgi:hypothetical protein
LAQAMSSTSATAALKMSSAGRASRTRSACMPATSPWIVALVWGYSSASRRTTASSPACACSTVAPGLSRPTTVRNSARRGKVGVSIASGAQSSTSAPKRNPGGITPITV